MLMRAERLSTSPTVGQRGGEPRFFLVIVGYTLCNHTQTTVELRVVIVSRRVDYRRQKRPEISCKIRTDYVICVRIMLFAMIVITCGEQLSQLTDCSRARH